MMNEFLLLGIGVFTLILAPVMWFVSYYGNRYQAEMDASLEGLTGPVSDEFLFVTALYALHQSMVEAATNFYPVPTETDAALTKHATRLRAVIEDHRRRCADTRRRKYNLGET